MIVAPLSVDIDDFGEAVVVRDQTSIFNKHVHNTTQYNRNL